MFLSQATGGSPSEEQDLVISYVRAAPTVAADAAQIRQSSELSNIAALNAGFGRRSYFEHTPLSTGVSNMVKIFSVDFLLNNSVNALCNDTSDFSFFSSPWTSILFFGLKAWYLGKLTDLNYRRTANFIITAAKIRATHFRLSSCAIRANSNIVLGTTLLIFSAWFLSQHLGIKFDFQLNWLSKLPRHGQFRFLRLIIAVSKSTLLLCESTFASSLISRPDVWSSKNLSNFKRSRLVFRGTVMSTHAPMKRLGFEFFTQHR